MTEKCYFCGTPFPTARYALPALLGRTVPVCLSCVRVREVFGSNAVMFEHLRRMIEFRKEKDFAKADFLRKEATKEVHEDDVGLAELEVELEEAMRTKKKRTGR